MAPRLIQVGLLLCTGCSPRPQVFTTHAPIAQTTHVTVPAPNTTTSAPTTASPAMVVISEYAATAADSPAPSDIALVPVDAVRTESGLASQVLKTGTGTTHPTDADHVIVHYTGWTRDGKQIDFAAKRGEPPRFAVRNMIPGFGEAVLSMVVGEKRRVWIPSNLAFGDAPVPPLPAGQLIFDIELLEIQAGPTPPADVAVAPKGAKRTVSGLRYLRLTEGNGKLHPNPRSRVTVHYTGWTKDGKMYDSSFLRDTPARFRLNSCVPGLIEGVQLMVEGEKTRFWIPGRLAWGDKHNTHGVPVGQVTFDVELIAIE